MENLKTKNPWLGLESYQEGEILYGRDEDIRELSQSVLRDNVTLLYGKSGIGKSSILNAGVIPSAKRNGFLPASVRLSHKDKRSYLTQVIDAIKGNGIKIEEVLPCKNPAKETFYEFFHRNIFLDSKGNRAKLLIIFDQFEEIFTLQENEQTKKKFFSEMADFINDIMPNDLAYDVNVNEEEKKVVDLSEDLSFDDIFGDINVDNNTPDYIKDNEIHLVFTIREDFLSEFEYYTSSIPLLKQNRYGLRPLNEEQAAQIIMRPLPGLITKSVAKLIIEKITGRTDFELDGVPEIEVDSAVLSLYMNRLFESRKHDAQTGRDLIDESLVEQKGGEIIADFYHDAISEISLSSVEYLEDNLLNGQGRRDNITVYDAEHDGHITQKELDILCNKKKILRQFNYANDLRLEFVHDILCPVVKEHKDERILLKKQEEERKKLEKERLKQEEERKRVIAEEHRKRQQLLEKARKERLRNHRRTIAMSVVILFLLVVGICVYFYRFHTYSDYFTSYELRNGKVVGVESTEISSTDRKTTPLYYCLKHRGYGTDISEIEVMTSNRMLPNSPRVAVLGVGIGADDDDAASEFTDKLSTVTKVNISEDERQRVIKEEYVDDNGNVSFEVNYSYLDNNSAMAHFVSANGQNMRIRQNGVEQAKLTWDDSGRPTGISYYDHNGVCQDIEPGVAGYLWNYENNNTVCKYILNEYQQPTVKWNYRYNTVYTRTNGDSIIRWYANSLSVGDKEITYASGPMGFVKEVTLNDKVLLYHNFDGNVSAKTEIKRDNRGNVLEERVTGALMKIIPQAISYKYSKDGLMLAKQLLDSRGRDFCPLGQDANKFISRWSWEYDKAGILIGQARISASGHTLYSRFVEKQGDVVRETINDVSKPDPFVVKIDSIKDGGKTVVSSFFVANNRPQNNKWRHRFAESDSMLVFHKMVETNTGNKITRSFYFYDDASKSIKPLPTSLNDFDMLTSYFRSETVFDNKGNRVGYTIVNAQGEIVKSMMYFYQNGQPTGRAVKGIDGTPVRCPKWEEEGFGYYRIFINVNNQGQYANIKAVNEWSETSVLYDGRQYFGTDYRTFPKYSFTLHYDNDKVSDNSNPYSQMLLVTPSDLSSKSIPYLHILDKNSYLYKKGFRDGDRLVACGLWRFGDSEANLESEWRKIGKERVSIRILRPTIHHSFTAYNVMLSPFNGQVKAENHIFALTNSECQQVLSFLKK